MLKINDVIYEKQEKIHKHMLLKYKWHRKIMVWMRFFVVLYSLLVFLFLVNFYHIDYYFRADMIIWVYVLLWVSLFFFFWFDESVDFFKVWIVEVPAVLFITLLIVVLLFFSGSFDFQISIWHTFFLFTLFICVYLFLCIVLKKKITRSTLLIIYFIFYSIFLFPVLLEIVSQAGLLWKLWSMLFWLSPFLLYIFRASLVDVLWSGVFIRRLFSKKDLEVWNCPRCRSYILKKPIKFCPHCGTDKFGINWWYNVYCRNCWFHLRVRDFDFPDYCPHCGLSFRKKIGRA